MSILTRPTHEPLTLLGRLSQASHAVTAAIVNARFAPRGDAYRQAVADLRDVWAKVSASLDELASAWPTAASGLQVAYVVADGWKVKPLGVLCDHEGVKRATYFCRECGGVELLGAIEDYEAGRQETLPVFAAISVSENDDVA